MDFLPFRQRARVHIAEAAFAKIGDSHGASVPQIALAWCACQGKPCPSILIGVSKTSQLDDNIGALGVTLTTEEIRAARCSGPSFRPSIQTGS